MRHLLVMIAALASDTSFPRFHIDNTKLPLFQISGASKYRIFVKKNKASRIGLPKFIAYAQKIIRITHKNFA